MGETVTMPEMLSTVLTFVWGQITTTMTTISTNALLLLPFGVALAGAIIGLSKRFLRFGGGRRGR